MFITNLSHSYSLRFTVFCRRSLFKEKIFREVLMDSEETPIGRRPSRSAASLLKQERERRGWTQSELAERIGTTQVNISRWEKSITVPGPYFRQKLGELFGKTLQELGLLIELEDSNNEQANTIFTSAIHRTHSPIWNIPYRRNPFFTGREEILAYLHNALNSNKRAALTQTEAISGRGGIGKTQIAVEYAYRNRDHYQAMLWATASSRDTLLADFVMLAALLNLPEQTEQDQDI